MEPLKCALLKSSQAISQFKKKKTLKLLKENIEDFCELGLSKCFWDLALNHNPDKKTSWYTELCQN